MTARSVTFWICVAASLSAGCGPTEEECARCESYASQIDDEASNRGISTAGVCGDRETGEGAMEGFEEVCERLRESCDFGSDACQ